MTLIEVEFEWSQVFTAEQQALQRELDAGWRILAVCVQPDQRRPDYVLGRSTPPGEP